MRLLPSYGEKRRGGNRDSTFLEDYIQRDGFQVLRKTFLDGRSGKRLGEDFHLKGKFFKKYIYKFSKVNAPRPVRAGLL